MNKLNAPEYFECTFPILEETSKKYTEVENLPEDKRWDEFIPLPDVIGITLPKDMENYSKGISSYGKQQVQNYLLMDGWEIIRVVKPLNKEKIYVALQDMIKYCTETFGFGGLYESLTDNDWSWCYFSQYGYWSFYFETKSDAEQFYSEGMSNSHKKEI